MSIDIRTLEALRNEPWFENLVMAEARSYHSGGNCKLCKPSMAEAWAEGWSHYRTYFSPSDPEFGKNPYSEGAR